MSGCRRSPPPMSHHSDVRLSRLAPIVALLALAACSDPASPAPARTARLPVPARGPASVQPGQPPVVWVSGQVSRVRRSSVVIVERSGARVVIRRLAEDATRFFAPRDARWISVASGDVATIQPGTPACAEAFHDRGVYLGIRVFLGAACGPRQ